MSQGGGDVACAAGGVRGPDRGRHGGRTYIAIDLKSFYASAECAERGLDPLDTHLVVADVSRTEKTICLAVSPSLKAYGIPGRARLFEVVRKVRQINAERRMRAPGHRLTGESCVASELKANPRLALSYVAAKPRMALYLERSAQIYGIYLKYAAAEDIHVYSIDEVFMDVTRYLRAAGMTPRRLAMTIVRDILANTGITATAGIGTNMYLAKVAMDIVAKHMPADRDGVRVAELDEMSYRRLLWGHRPLTDFWRVGRGYARRLEAHGITTMGDIARCSLGGATDYPNEDLLYRLFGVNAEPLIDHAWGWEPCTIADIKAYRPESSSMSSGQVLHEPYDFTHARVIVKEMADQLALDMTGKGLRTDHVSLMVGYDIENLGGRKDDCGMGKAPGTDASRYAGVVATDHYGRKVPKAAHSSADLETCTSSSRRLVDAVVGIYDRIVDPDLTIRRITVVFGRLRPASTAESGVRYEQPDLFTDADREERRRRTAEAEEEREHDMQMTLLNIKHRFGRNAVIKGMNLEEGATGIERNSQIGGHAA
ncbi:DinB/UmuC family translesion DNA polymerase [Bifidobacterium catulorum]|uniref:Type VI secretion protein ImpB n=1 Tax=Bifidobacterium catulorum TaxID=1630173 RepID=A0A2U2MS34_9BIFI|nr:type VI secretion protein ImpB [Bifidobacterium catulorum]PWG59675.1 type VI secretion protein ImpB [Bifidobacterium catulorum]